MPDISTMKQSKFLASGDAKERPLLLTIANPPVTQEDVAMEGQKQELKWVLHFVELAKGLVLNSINMELAAAACGSTNTDHWAGKKVVLYHDPNISFGGRLTGGLRLRVPRQPQAPAAPPAPASPVTPPPAVAPPVDPTAEPVDDSDVPF